MWRHIHAGAACALVLLVAGAAQAELQDENLILPLPDGFKAASQTADKSRLVREFTPAAEAADDWTIKVTEKIFRDSKNSDPEMFQYIAATLWKSICPKGEGGRAVTSVERGYKISIWAFTCPPSSSPKTERVMVSKVIAGADATYTVDYIWRGPVTKEHVDEANRYLRQVLVCDTRRPDRPCPDGLK